MELGTGVLKDQFNAVFKDIDTVLLSREIIEGGYLNHWKQFACDYGDDSDFAFAQRIVDARKVVLSKTLKVTKCPGTELAQWRHRIRLPSPARRVLDFRSAHADNKLE